VVFAVPGADFNIMALANLFVKLNLVKSICDVVINSFAL
jgi:hypothetical protein